MLPLFVPWALLPWEVAWFVWRGATILLLLWSIHWAYSRRPLPTAILITILAFPMAANLDTGNINLLLALSLFGAQFVGAKAGGLIWGLATWMKWVPAVLWFVLQPRARGWGLVFLAVFALLSLALLPLTIIQLQVLFGFGQRPVRADYLVYIWSAVPWWWRHRDPFAFLRLSSWREAAAFQLARARRWWGSWRADPGRRRASPGRGHGSRSGGSSGSRSAAVAINSRSPPRPRRPAIRHPRHRRRSSRRRHSARRRELRLRDGWPQARTGSPLGAAIGCPAASSVTVVWRRRSDRFVAPVAAYRNTERSME